MALPTLLRMFCSDLIKWTKHDPVHGGLLGSDIPCGSLGRRRGEASTAGAPWSWPWRPPRPAPARSPRPYGGRAVASTAADWTATGATRAGIHGARRRRRPVESARATRPRRAAGGARRTPWSRRCCCCSPLLLQVPGISPWRRSKKRPLAKKETLRKEGEIDVSWRKEEAEIDIWDGREEGGEEEEEEEVNDECAWATGGLALFPCQITSKESDRRKPCSCVAVAAAVASPAPLAAVHDAKLAHAARGQGKGIRLIE